ncbi:Fucose permease [Saccharopolyspora antimicrobica]|uniref:Fucose permease n=1 Tax=Saccharopolyspora antimicrobica TaxID=455193 RepID=A0A1I5E532_9PSEU|nr:MFS transporter [Saccharopolyspora antimicrobica]RKT86669.1 fucose permease [Saccharopolyspora antimicrobica]SFO06572.1 Fucose permease [Saccharopolyspora antimicrobica]
MSETSVVVPQRARWAVTAYFVSTGAALGTWTGRIPAIKQDLGLDEGQVTLALFAVAAGSVLAMQAVGHLADRYGSARVLRPAGLAMAASLLVPGFAGSLPVLLVGLLLFGAGHGTVDVAMNTHAMQVQRGYGRPIVSTFHAMFSVGGLLGAGAGALAAHASIGVGAHFALVGAALAAVLLMAGRELLPPEAQVRSGSAPRQRGISPGILFLGVLAFFCSVGEGSMADWSPLYLHDVLETGPAVAAIGYAVFSAMMAVFRFLGDFLVTRLGPVVLVRCCGAIAGTGLGTALLLHHPVAAIIGFALFGIGLSCIIPQVFSAAGSRDPSRSGRDLAQVSTLGYGGLLAGPVVIGLISSWTDLSIGLAVPAALALLVALSAPAVRPR